tara:strand:+ start:118 stop:738 length:621 start_codon:yes stop_codon:yes gene_type:complete
MNIHIGCAYTIGKSWKNYDATPTAVLEKIPLIGKIIKINQKRFPRELIYGDITRKLLSPKNEAQNIFCSHVLEHLSNDEMKNALNNIYQMLKPNGCFRLIVPNLENRVKKYIDDKDANNFIEKLGMGQKNINNNIFSKIKSLFGNTKHLWMYDYDSLSLELSKVGFINIRNCNFGDSQIEVFSEIEEKNRFIDDNGMPEICIECTK